MVNFSKFYSFLIWLIFFSIPISTASANISFYFFMATIIIYMIAKYNQMENFKKIFEPPILIFIVFSIYLLLSWFLSIDSMSQNNFNKIKGYIPFLFIPIIAVFLSSIRGVEKFALEGFSAGMILTLFISYSIYFSLCEFSILVSHLNYKYPIGFPENPIVFKRHITQNFFMAIAVVYWGYLFISSLKHISFYTFFWGLIFLAGIFNVIFMVQGRIGYLILLMGVLYFSLIRKSFKFYILSFIYIFIIFILFFIFSNNFNNRIFLAYNELINWKLNTFPYSSIGLRLDFIFNSLEIIKNNFFWGVGFGGFAESYSKFSALNGVLTSENPHNQYILFLVEIGFFGFVLYFLTIYNCFKFRNSLDIFWRDSISFILLSYFFANLFNSFFLDFSESMFFSLFIALGLSKFNHYKT